MRVVEVTGSTVDEAVAEALRQLRVDRDEVDVEVLEEGRGLLGLLKQPARVRVRIRGGPGALGPEAAAWLQRTIAGVGLKGSVVLREETADHILLDIETDEDPGVFIGRGGDMLASLGLLVAAIINQGEEGRKRVEVDVDGYRVRREESLKREVLTATREARSRGRPVSLRPMPAHERRLVHVLLETELGVSTASIGRDPYRKVVITPTGEAGERPPARPYEADRGRDRDRAPRPDRGRDRGDAPRRGPGGPPRRDRPSGPPRKYGEAPRRYGEPPRRYGESPVRQDDAPPLRHDDEPPLRHEDRPPLQHDDEPPLRRDALHERSAADPSPVVPPALPRSKPPPPKWRRPR